MLPHSKCHIPAFTPANKAGTQFSDVGGMQGKVNLVGLVTVLIAAQRWSPIPVLTELIVEYLHPCNERRYRYTKPPTNNNCIN